MAGVDARMTHCQSGCCIHYTVNDDRIQHGDSIMVDAGGSYGGYAADVTRCWPAAGRFVDPGFFDVYCSVLNVQRRLITMCSARAHVSLHTLHRESVRLLEAELRNLSLRIDPVVGLLRFKDSVTKLCAASTSAHLSALRRPPRWDGDP